jgi:hypothetical protein
MSKAMDKAYRALIRRTYQAYRKDKTKTKNKRKITYTPYRSPPKFRGASLICSEGFMLPDENNKNSNI